MRDADRREFEELFRHEYPAVVRTVRLVLGDQAVAEDVVQDAFTQLIVHWRKVSRYERPGAWVRRVALRMALRWRTRRRAEQRALTLVGTGTAQTGVDPDLVRGLRSLTAIQRAAVALFYFEDRPIAEVADLLGCANGTAKTHLHRARHRLAALLREEEDSDVT